MTSYKNFTPAEIRTAIKKAEIITNKVVDLQDLGFGDSRTQSIQDNANALLSELYNEESRRYNESHS